MRPHIEIAARLRRIVSCGVLLIGINAIFAFTAFTQQGGSFEMKSSVIAGGGGASTNGSTRIDGTVGQGILGSSTGGSFSLLGGFWQNQPASFVDIAGQVTFCSATQPPGVPNVTLNVTGGVTASTVTNASGNYDLASLNLPAGGTYTVTPTKTGAVSGIDSTDALRILQSIAGTLNLTACQQLAAD